MDLLLELIVTLSRWSRGHLYDIALAILAALLVLFGPGLNQWLQRKVSAFNFVLRTLAFVLVCAIGYGLAIGFLTPWLMQGLGQFNNYTLAPVLLVVFVVIGILADRR